MASNNLTVDEFIQTRVQPQHRELAEKLRALMREVVPEAREIVAYGIPAWKIHKIFAVLSPTKKDLTFAFTHGREFEDQYGLLRGVGKIGLHVKIKDLEHFHEEALKYYIRQAVERDS